MLSRFTFVIVLLLCSCKAHQPIVQNNNTENTKLFIQSFHEGIRLKLQGNYVEAIDRFDKCLTLDPGLDLIHPTVEIVNSVVIQPCFIGEGVKISNSIVGPHTSIGDYSLIKNSVLTNCLIQHQSSVSNFVLKDAMIGAHANIHQKPKDYSIGDYTTMNDAE